MSLTRDQILAAPEASAIAPKTVKVPEWGGIVFVRALGGDDRDAFEASIVSTRKGDKSERIRNIRARLVIACACDDKGIPLFTDADADALGRKWVKPLDRVFAVAQKLNALGDGDVEDLAGN